MIASVMLCDLSPHPNASVLEIFVLPEQSSMKTRVRVPALILTTWECMHVEDCVDSPGCASINNFVHQFEAALPYLKRSFVIHEMPMIDGNADAVQPKACQELGIFLCEEVVEEPFEEIVVLFLAHHI